MDTLQLLESFTPEELGQISSTSARTLNRSAGAVGNALKTLAERSEAEPVPGKPARYRATGATKTAAGGMSTAPAPKPAAPPKPAPAAPAAPGPAPSGGERQSAARYMSVPTAGRRRDITGPVWKASVRPC